MYYKRNPVDGKVQAAGAGAYNPAGMKDGEVKGMRIRESRTSTNLIRYKPSET